MLKRIPKNRPHITFGVGQKPLNKDNKQDNAKHHNAQQDVGNLRAFLKVHQGQQFRYNSNAKGNDATQNGIFFCQVFFW